MVVAALVTACGSTAQVSSTGVIGGGQQATTGGDGLGLPGTTGSPLDGGTGAVTGGVGTSGGGTSGGVAGSSGAPGTTGTGGTGAAVQSRHLAPGVTGKVVYVGINHDANADGVNQAVGIGAISHGDDRANTQAIIDDINKHGGVGGRKLEAVYAPVDSTSTQTLDQQDAAACQVYTRDRPVFAVVDANREGFRDCVGRAGVLALTEGLPTVGEESFRRHPLYLEMGYPNLDRLARYHVTPLDEQKYFTPWDTINARPAAAGEVRVGVLTYNDRIFSEAVDRHLVPALKRRGFPVVVVKIAPLATASDAGAQAAAIKSAQLTFASNRVTHVLTFETNGNLSTFFLPSARSQGYYPRLGVNTASATEALIEAGITEPRQMNGAVGYGWMPTLDLRQQDNPVSAPWSNANRRHCLQVMREHGITFDSGNAEGIGLSSCASLYLLKQVLDAHPDGVQLGAFVPYALALGRSYQPAGVVGVGFRPGRQDPTDRAYYWRYVSACGCFRYFGTPHTVP
jgi:ABC-type branched-subunit amino acid transport system substrate-binding protein